MSGLGCALAPKGGSGRTTVVDECTCFPERGSRGVVPTGSAGTTEYHIDYGDCIARAVSRQAGSFILGWILASGVSGGDRHCADTVARSSVRQTRG